MANKLKNRMNELGKSLDDLRDETKYSLARLKRIINDGEYADHWEAADIATALECEPTDIFTTDGAGAWTVRSKGGPF